MDRGRSERARARLRGRDLAGRVRRHRGGPPAPARRRRRPRTGRGVRDDRGPGDLVHPVGRAAGRAFDRPGPLRAPPRERPRRRHPSFRRRGGELGADDRHRRGYPPGRRAPVRTRRGAGRGRRRARGERGRGSELAHRTRGPARDVRSGRRDGRRPRPAHRLQRAARRPGRDLPHDARAGVRVRALHRRAAGVVRQQHRLRLARRPWWRGRVRHGRRRGLPLGRRRRTVDARGRPASRRSARCGSPERSIVRDVAATGSGRTPSPAPPNRPRCAGSPGRRTRRSAGARRGSSCSRSSAGACAA